MKAIRLEKRQSWVNIKKAVLSLQDKRHEPFGTPKVEANAKSCLRRIFRETELTPETLESLLDQNGH